MKLQKIILTAVIAATFGIVGCSKKSSVDTAPLEKSFASADAPTKSASDSVVSEVKSANYSGAMADLTKLAQNAKLTPEQQQAVKDVLAQVQKAMADAAGSAAADANKAAGDLQKSLPK
jgi:hypothetical protein